MAETKRWTGQRRNFKITPFVSRFTKTDCVLDAGCGVGIELSALSHIVAYSVGLDIDPSNLRVARNFLAGKLRNIDFVQADICFLPFRDSAFSQVMCFDVLEHLLYPKIVMTRFKDILRPQGEIFIRLPNKLTLHELLLLMISMVRRSNGLWNVRHVSFFSIKKIIKLLQKEGLSYQAGYTWGSLALNMYVSLLTVASISLNIIFAKNYPKSRHYYRALGRRFPKSKSYFLSKASQMPLFSYFTLVFRKDVDV